nr:helix-turn-helix domain-containing GNAT family N-acetyltransferase [uncultured Flavobacterium sp.]
MKLFEKTGKMALGSRLRLLTSRMTDEASEIYSLYHNEFSPKWFPAFFALAEGGPQTITEISEYIGHSQPSATKLIKEMTEAGLCQNVSASDKRKNTVELTEKGNKLSEKFKVQYKDIDAAVQGLIDEATHNLWLAVEEWEGLLKEKSLLQRVKEQKTNRESKEVEIVAYEDKYQSVFKALNEEWISTYFEMEAVDYKALDNPKEYILDKGGKIFVALYKGEPLGVCALIKMYNDEYDFELAKMAVSPKAQGKHLGLLLGYAIINEARELGGKKLYLESNTALKPAIKLYEKLGFKKIYDHPSPYKRVDIQMGLNL